MAELEDPELLRILHGEPAEESSTLNPVRLPDGRVRVRLLTWSGLLDLLDDGVRVASSGPETVVVILPDAEGELVLPGETEGGWLRLGPTTLEVGLMLEALRTRAANPSGDDAWVERLQSKLHGRLRGADATVLGLPSDASPKDIQRAYTRTREAWEGVLGEGPVPARLRSVLDEYAARLGQLCAQLVVSTDSPRERSGPPRSIAAPVRVLRPVGPLTASADATPPEPSRAVVRNARRFMARLAPDRKSVV